jgi:molybdopterin-guanine dinucleotide biosynthesis protein A
VAPHDLENLEILGNLELIVLTGGTSRRFGSDKSVAKIGDKTSLEWIVSAVPPDLPIIIVGPHPTISWDHPAGIRVVRESPIGGGPVAGLFAGLQIAKATMVLLVATDMPFVMAYLLGLVEEARDALVARDALDARDARDARDALDGADCLLYRDNEGFLQPLAGLYKSAALRDRFAEIGEPAGESMRHFIGGLTVVTREIREDMADAFLDMDTTAELEKAIAYAHHLSAQRDVEGMKFHKIKRE